jgi:capsule polysaccharide modification protein KpsS
MKAGQAGEMLSRIGLLGRYASIDKLKLVCRAWKYRRKYPDDISLAYQHGDPIRLSWAYFLRALRRRIRFNSVREFYKVEPRPGRFLLYPLHFHPEASTSVLAPDFVDEMHVIKSIAFRLPSDIRLVVKEHPSAVSMQPLDFYRQLSQLPNVDLLAAHVSAKRLARESVGVVCVTSTLGFEAAAMGKPVIALGDVLYGYFPNVRMVRTCAEINSALDWALTYRGCPQQEVLEAMAAYAAFTAPGAFDFRASLGDTVALQSVADLLEKKIAATSRESNSE